MPKLNQRGVIAQALILILLLLGAVVGVYLVQNRTNLLPKAGGSRPIGPETSFTLTGPDVCSGGWTCFLTGKPQPQEEFDVKLYAKSDLEQANLFVAKMTFPKDLVEVKQIKKEGSFIKNWVEEYYDNNTGVIDLAGGVPSPGFQTQTGGESALIATITFKAKALGKGSVAFTNSSAIYSNLNNIDILTIKRNYDLSVEVKPQPTPLPEGYLVKPYLVYPADKPMYPEYESAVKAYMTELQQWYQKQVGVTFYMAPLQIVRSKYSYDVMRCDPNPNDSTAPTDACLKDPKKLDGNWGYYMNIAIHNGIEKWEEKTAALIFSAGGGGFAGANKITNDAGYAIVGDWVLEPISGKANEWGIPCKYSDGWQCSGGVPKGTPAHELGHAFGLPHPGAQYKDQTIMQWHGNYPLVGFISNEIQFLKSSPFFKNQLVLPSATPISTPQPTPKPGPKGDGNKDGKVNLIDMSVLHTDYKIDESVEKIIRAGVDMNSDGFINTADFTLLRNLLIDLKVIKVK